VDYRASFVDGSGSRRVLDSMWPLVAPLVDAALAIPVGEVAAAVRLLAERARVIAEGAGALAPAAALSGRAAAGPTRALQEALSGRAAAGPTRALQEALGGRPGPWKIVCVVSGGNINLSKLAEILNGAAG
jgi:threonine dehydratase